MKDIIIFGSSPFINEISDLIPELMEKYDSIGINVFPAFYPAVKHWFFYDDKMIGLIKTHYKGQILHTRYDLREKITNLGVKPEDLEIFYPACEIFPKDKKDFLYFKNYTITIAIDWCIKNGYENVYLAGVDMDSEEWYHFYDTYCMHRTKIKGLERTAKAIEELQKHINIFQLNQKTNKVQKLPISDIEKLI